MQKTDSIPLSVTTENFVESQSYHGLEVLQGLLYATQQNSLFHYGDGTFGLGLSLIDLSNIPQPRICKHFAIDSSR